jgi:hypothetical protein
VVNDGAEKGGASCNEDEDIAEEVGDFGILSVWGLLRAAVGGRNVLEEDEDGRGNWDVMALWNETATRNNLHRIIPRHYKSVVQYTIEPGNEVYDPWDD